MLTKGSPGIWHDKSTKGLQSRLKIMYQHTFYLLATLQLKLKSSHMTTVYFSATCYCLKYFDVDPRVSTGTSIWGCPTPFIHCWIAVLNHQCAEIKHIHWKQNISSTNERLSYSRIVKVIKYDNESQNIILNIQMPVYTWYILSLMEHNNIGQKFHM